jgi:exosome complex component RRP45
MARNTTSSLSTNERDFILAALKDNVRIDGRSIYDFRKLIINFGTTPGHSDVQLGGTRLNEHIILLTQFQE